MATEGEGHEAGNSATPYHPIHGNASEQVKYISLLSVKAMLDYQCHFREQSAYLQPHSVGPLHRTILTSDVRSYLTLSLCGGGGGESVPTSVLSPASKRAIST